MPRRPRVCPAGEYFHVLNRAVARLPLFEKTEDFEWFERVLAEADDHLLMVLRYVERFGYPGGNSPTCVQAISSTHVQWMVIRSIIGGQPAVILALGPWLN